MAKTPRVALAALPPVTVVTAWTVLIDGEMVAAGETLELPPAEAEALIAAGHICPEPPASPALPAA